MSDLTPSILRVEDHYLVDYLVDEVLSRQPADVREFLAYTSILERFCLPLCRAIMGESFPVFETQQALERQGLFIVALDDQHNWYRFHELFRQFLQLRLEEQLGPEAIAEIHQRAAQWLATQGYTEDAISHALLGGDTNQAVAILAGARQTLMNDEQWFILESLLAKFPPEAVRVHPVLVTLRAWLNLAKFQLDKTAAAIDRLELLMATATVTAKDARFVNASLHAFKAVILDWANDFDGAIANARQALQLTAEDSELEQDYAWLHLTVATYHTQGYAAARAILAEESAVSGPGSQNRFRNLQIACFVQLAAADLPSLLETATQGLSLAPSDSNQLYLSWFAVHAGMVHYECNELAQAEYFLSAVMRRRYLAHPIAVVQSAIGLSKIHIAHGRFSAAQEMMETEKQYCQEQRSSQCLQLVKTYQAELALWMGDFDPARRWIAQAELGRTVPILSNYYNAQIALPRLLLAENTADSRRKARAELAHLYKTVTATRQTYYRIEVLAMQALLLEAEGDHSAADTALAKAIRLAQPSKIIRMFVDLGPALIRPLRQLARQDGSSAYVRKILDAFQLAQHMQGIAAGVETLAEPLTRREIEVIKLLEKRLSNKEIAEVLIIAPTTAKRHTINIYQKLGVSGRREAVVRARDLGILKAS